MSPGLSTPNPKSSRSTSSPSPASTGPYRPSD